MSMGPMNVMRGGARAPERSKDLRGTTRRLLGRLRPERTKLALALVLGVTSVAFMVSGPEILGNATNVPRRSSTCATTATPRSPPWSRG